MVVDADLPGYYWEMDTKEAADLTRWVQCWQEAGPRLAEIRRGELQNLDTQQALLRLADAFESCRLHAPPRPTSGLVEQQAWFQKLRQ